MHKQEQTKRLKPHRIWIIDVDQTTTQKHTYHLDRQNQKLESKAERQDGRSMEDEKIYANLRNPGWLRSFIEERHKEGELVLFLTFHPNLPHVAAYLSVLFNEKELRKIADEDKNIFREKGVDSEDVIFSYYLTLNQPFIGIFSCQADTTGEGKNLAIDKVFKLLKEKFSIVTPYEKNIFLIDDDEFNYWAAIRKGIRAVLANPANDYYMEEVKKIIAMPLVEPRSQQSSYNSLGKSLGIKRDYLRISSGDEEEIITDEEKTDNDETNCDEITSNIEHVVTSDIEPNKNVSSPPALTDGSKIVDNTPPSPTKRAKLTMSN